MYFVLIHYDFKGNYDYYHNLFCFIYLFCAHKKFFSQLGLVIFYFLSTAGKIHPSWVLTNHVRLRFDQEGYTGGCRPCGGRHLTIRRHPHYLERKTILACADLQ